MTTCPKCGYERQPSDTAPDYECPKCGVIYQKYLDAQAAKIRQAEDQAAREAARADEQRKRDEQALVAAEAKRQAGLTACKTCGGVVAWEAKACPHCGQKKPAGRKPVSRQATVLVLLGLGLFIAAAANVPRDGKGTDNFEVISTCRAVVEKVLKAPSTAKFISGEDSVRRREDGSINVSGYVDAQNGFGAMLRNEYECEVVQVGGGLKVQHAGLNGEVLF